MMFEQPFELSMLQSPCIICCPDRDLVGELFQIFVENGISWAGGSDMDNTRWESNNTCYRVNRKGKLTYGTTLWYSDSVYSDYIKCTFYGLQTDSESIDESEWISILENMR